jgi:uncharacterized membrane protein
MRNVAVATFDDPSGAYQAMAELHKLAEQGSLHIGGAALVRRDVDGSWTFGEEDHEKASFTGSIAGGVAGAAIGAVAGPLGIIFGAIIGAPIGAMADMVSAEKDGGIESTFPLLVPPGATALVADIDEPEPRAFDTAMEAIGGKVTRIDRGVLEAEVAASEQAVREAEHHQ